MDVDTWPWTVLARTWPWLGITSGESKPTWRSSICAPPRGRGGHSLTVAARQLCHRSGADVSTTRKGCERWISSWPARRTVG